MNYNLPTQITNQRISTLTTFQGYSERTYIDPLVSGFGYIFITAPRLFIDQIESDIVPFSNLAYENIKRDPKTAKYIQGEQFGQIEKEIIKMLSYNNSYTSTGFLPIFTNLARGIEPQEVSLETTDAFQTTHGFRQTLSTHSVNSRATTQISIPFVETSDMVITKTIELWVNYIENISDGTFTPHPQTILNGELDYVSDIYYIMLDPDGQTIKYYTKWVACHPINIPYSRMSYNKQSRDVIELDISFNCIGGVEHMDPSILEDFNMSSLLMNNVDAITMLTENESTHKDYFSRKSSQLLVPLNLLTTSSKLVDKVKNNPLVFLMTDTASNTSRFALSFGPDTFNNDNFRNTIMNSDVEDKADIMKGDELYYGTPYLKDSTNTGNPSIYKEIKT